jgi:hypothetical protein
MERMDSQARPILNLSWSFAASVFAKSDGVDGAAGSGDLPVGRFVERAVESFS